MSAESPTNDFSPLPRSEAVAFAIQMTLEFEGRDGLEVYLTRLEQEHTLAQHMQSSASAAQFAAISARQADPTMSEAEVALNTARRDMTTTLFSGFTTDIGRLAGDIDQVKDALKAPAAPVDITSTQS